MIFATYAGTGKSFAAEELDKVLDMAIVPYKYIFTSGKHFNYWRDIIRYFEERD